MIKKIKMLKNYENSNLVLVEGAVVNADKLDPFIVPFLVYKGYAEPFGDIKQFKETINYYYCQQCNDKVLKHEASTKMLEEHLCFECLKDKYLLWGEN